MVKTNNIHHIIKSSIINHTKNIIKDYFEYQSICRLTDPDVSAIFSRTELIINIY
jgi:hypothetical protein